jgi:hypothetical protein
MENRMRKHFALTLLPLLIASAFADVSPPSQDGQQQPRMLGQKAVLHIYYYAPKTLESRMWTHICSRMRALAKMQFRLP